MKRNRLGYFIREGVGSIFNHGFMSFASVCIIIACLIIMGSFSLVAFNVNEIIGELEAENQIVAFVNEDYTAEQAQALQSTLEAVPNVASVQYISRDQAMESFTDQYDSNLFDGIDSSVLRDRYIVYLDDITLMSQTQDSLRGVDGIVKVNAHLEIAQGFITVRNVVSVVSLILVVVLLIVSLFIMTNTIKLTTFERREEIAIMKMVGATSNFIRWPFVIEGLLLGLMGSLTAYIAQWGLYSLAVAGISAASSFSFLNPISFSEVSFPMLIAFMVLGLGVGIIGSLMAIRNYLKV